MSYDPNFRRDTPLARTLKERIRSDGPMTVGDFVSQCLTDPEHGYYRRRTAIGESGDFITAPEISQTFGELIGLWAAVVWTGMGQPRLFNLIELGPGRGTLMRDALRAVQRVDGFLAAARVTLVDVSEPMRLEQQAALAGTPAQIAWAGSLDEVDLSQPTIVIGNEYLDALGVSQWVRAGADWRVRRVGLDAQGALAFAAGEAAAGPDPVRDAGAADGVIAERAGFLDDPNLQRLGEAPVLAGLFIDYGYVEPAAGDTLQAVRAHAFEHPLTSPGEADLTLHVDFSAVAAMARGLGLAVDGPVTQAEFLGRLGIIERASRLMNANPSHAGGIEMGVARLLAPGGMGSRFKVIGLRSTGVSPLPGLEA